MDRHSGYGYKMAWTGDRQNLLQSDATSQGVANLVDNFTLMTRQYQPKLYTDIIPPHPSPYGIGYHNDPVTPLPPADGKMPKNGEKNKKFKPDETIVPAPKIGGGSSESQNSDYSIQYPGPAVFMDENALLHGIMRPDMPIISSSSLIVGGGDQSKDSHQDKSDKNGSQGQDEDKSGSGDQGQVPGGEEGQDQDQVGSKGQGQDQCGSDGQGQDKSGSKDKGSDQGADQNKGADQGPNQVPTSSGPDQSKKCTAGQTKDQISEDGKGVTDSGQGAPGSQDKDKEGQGQDPSLPMDLGMEGDGQDTEDLLLKSQESDQMVKKKVNCQFNSIFIHYLFYIFVISIFLGSIS